MLTKKLLYRICSYTVFDDTNADGWWCADCDSYNYWDSSKHDEARFTVILEDKNIQEQHIKSNNNFKKQLSPLRYPGGKSKLINYLATYLRERKCKTLVSPFLVSCKNKSNNFTGIYRNKWKYVLR